LFHLLADTETKLKDAVQSRYVLEIGLVKLIEMRKLSSVETVLNRLNDLEARVGGIPQPAAMAAAVSEEKKTLKSDPVSTPVEAPNLAEASADHPEISQQEPDLGIGYRDLAEPDEARVEESPATPEPVPKTSSYDDLSFVASLPVKLPPIASEDLEHFPEKALDAQFDRKLELLDENFGPIPQVYELVRRAIGERAVVPVVAVSNGAAAAPARAPLNIQIPDFGEERGWQ
jgi:hypothetical protein